MTIILSILLVTGLALAGSEVLWQSLAGALMLVGFAVMARKVKA